jgi:hypothetical protein
MNPQKQRGRPRLKERPLDFSAGWLTAVSALYVGGGCRQPRRRHHGTRTNRDGALDVARNGLEGKAGVAMLPNGVCRDNALQR